MAAGHGEHEEQPGDAEEGETDTQDRKEPTPELV
jgi:hypothetical protein